MSTRLQDIENRYRAALREIPTDAVLSNYLLKVFNDVLIIITDASLLQFNTLFARISYLVVQYQLSKAWSFAFQVTRQEIQHRQHPDAELIPIASSCVEYLFEIGRAKPGEKFDSPTRKPPDIPKLRARPKQEGSRIQYTRVVATSWDSEHKLLQILDENEPGKIGKVHYAETGVNDLYSSTLELAIREIGLPLTLGLHDILCSDELDYTPSYIIIMPDLLLDVTDVAEFTGDGHDPGAFNILKPFLPSKSTPSLLIGKVSNYFLDEMIRDEQLTFKEAFARSFKLFPMEFVRLDDQELSGMMAVLERHFHTIRNVINNRFPVQGIKRDHCIIEPTYYSPSFGLKGRLDLFYQHEEEKKASIIELKSSRPFKPNSYGLSSSHYHQTLLYDLLIKSVYGAQLFRLNFILYSSEAADPLRHAVSVDYIQKETIQNRNQLVLLQYRLMNLAQENKRDVLAEIDPERFPSIKGFIRQHMEGFHAVYTTLTVTEKKYLQYFTSFIAREHMLARIGNETGEGTGGLAGLWLDSQETKEAGYQILTRLELISVVKQEQQTLLTFHRSENTNPLANFRSGDIAILYPHDNKADLDPTKFQLHRAVILELSPVQIQIRLRNNQVNLSLLEKVRYWNVEHDLLDSSFRSMYQSLWALMNTESTWRQMILGQACPPPNAIEASTEIPNGMTPVQQRIFLAGIASESLYLLWGPPGTGKTSVMLKQWVAHYFLHTPARILLLAYTNRAVDEICAALHLGDPDLHDQYLRIGSRAATHEAFRHRLLDAAIEPLARRSDIKSVLESTRIFVGTVASVLGKEDLFDLIRFDIAIIDEASQLLEPAIVGLLTRVKKAILIGDHMQLPAVSIQEAGNTLISGQDRWALPLMLTDMSMSYFERLYRLYLRNHWHHLIGSLREQGRMHADIMAFANEYVYDGLLSCVSPEGKNLSMSSLFHQDQNPLFQSRMVFIPARGSIVESYAKTNHQEAEMVVELIRQWQHRLRSSELDWNIGVITPFRAQIAAITYLAHQQDLDLHGITIDTVERYQGGARDIIILSCAANHPGMLEKITSINLEGIDRKLNVAVTRAKQQFILVGVEAVLLQAAGYTRLMAKCTRIYPEELDPRKMEPYHADT